MGRVIKAWQCLPEGAKASAALFFASIVSKGIAYITTPIYTRSLTPAEYGQTSIFLTWVQVFGIISMFCLSYGVFNNGMIDYKESRDEYSLSMLILSNVITICFSVVFLLIYPYTRSLIGVDYPLAILMCILFFFQPAYDFYVARNRYELKYRSTVFWTILLAISSPVVALICIKRFDNHLYARLFGAEGTLIVFYVGFYVYIVLRGKGHFKTKYWKEALLFNLPLIPHYISTYLLGSSDKIMISRLVGDSAAAYYSVAYSVASVAMIFWTAVNASLIPFTYEKCENKDYNAISTVTLPILLLFSVVCVLVIMLAPEVVKIMATEDYYEAVVVIPPIVGGVFFQVQYFIYANIVYYYKKPKYVMIASITATALNIILNYIFIPKFGYAAAGYTTVFCYFVQAVIDYFSMRFVVGESVYNMRYLGALSLGVILISLLSVPLYNLALVRYLVLAVILGCVILFRRKIIDLILSIKQGREE